MYKKLNNLAFVIGAFFTIVSVILAVNMLVTGNSNALNIYSASAFLVFGVLMMFSRDKKQED